MFNGSFLPNWLLSRPDLPANYKLVYARLAQFAGKDGRAYPSHKTLGDEVGLGFEAIRKILRGLVDLNLLEAVQNHREDGSNSTNSYYFLEHPWMATDAIFDPTPGMGVKEGGDDDTGGGGYDDTTQEEIQIKENQGREEEAKPPPPGGKKEEGKVFKDPSFGMMARVEGEVSKLIDLYHEVLPTLPRVIDVPKKLRAVFSSAWKLRGEKWRGVFERAKTSDFLNGRNETGWVATLSWIVFDENTAKILNGHYDNRVKGKRFNNDNDGLTDSQMAEAKVFEEYKAKQRRQLSGTN